MSGSSTGSGNSVTELNASNGSLVRVLSAGSYAFNGPDDIADDGTHVWVANYDGKSVTELNASNGSLVRVLSAESYAFNDPAAIASDDTHVWVALNDHGKSVTELNASNGSLVQVLSAGSYAFNSPAAIAKSVGTHVWVGNNPTGSGSVTELNAGDGRWVRTLSAASYGFYSPSAITVNGTQVSVARRFQQLSNRDVGRLTRRARRPQAVAGDCDDSLADDPRPEATRAGHHQPEQARLGGEHRDIGQAVPAQRQRRRQIRDDLPRVVHRPRRPPPGPAWPTGPRPGPSPAAPGQQQGARLGHDPDPWQRDARGRLTRVRGTALTTAYREIGTHRAQRPDGISSGMPGRQLPSSRREPC